MIYKQHLKRMMFYSLKNCFYFILFQFFLDALLSSPINSIPIRDNNFSLIRSKRSLTYTSSDDTSRKSRAWTRSYLSYSILGEVANRNQTQFSAVRQTLKLAFADWQANSHFKFRDITPSIYADIKVIFTRDDFYYKPSEMRHNCGRKFSKNPAHAFFKNHKKTPGEIHVNNEFIWLESTRPQGSISLKTILLHEIGHVLGLEHSNEQNSIMYPFIYTNKEKSIGTRDAAVLRSFYAESLLK